MKFNFKMEIVLNIILGHIRIMLELFKHRYRRQGGYDKKMQHLWNSMELNNASHIVRNREQFHKSINEYIFSLIDYEERLEQDWKNGDLQSYYGFCEVCERYVAFQIKGRIDMRTGKVNWREDLKCPVCGCVNRNRKVYEIAKKIDNNKLIYITERVTPLFFNLKKIFPNLIGSEYIHPSIVAGSQLGLIRHEDFQNLSFNDNSFDYIISCDVLEHVVDYKRALKECYRCLRTNGQFIFTVPFNFSHNRDEVRTVVRDNKIEYLKTPEIHGNPIGSKGALVYTIPGWDIFQVMRKIGFSDCYAEIYFDKKRGYLGHSAHNGGFKTQIVFFGRK